MQLQEFLRFLTIPFAGFNFIDIAIIIIILVYVFEGYALGFIRGFADFITFILSFLFGLTFYATIGDLLVSNLKIPAEFGNALGFFLGAFLCEVILSIIFRKLLLPYFLDKTSRSNYSFGKETASRAIFGTFGDIASLPYVRQAQSTKYYSQRTEKLLGIIPGILSALTLLAFVLTMIVALPLSPFLKDSVAKSKLGNPLVSNITGFDKKINNIFGGTVNDALTFLTVEPESQELLKLNFSTDNVTVDQASEAQMFTDVNSQRASKGIGALTLDQALTAVARAHCKDMFAKGYFSHYTPDGKSPFDRMAEADIQFTNAGENLALAPDEGLAMQGLMNSPGHRANILSKNYNKIGIGVIDSGIYGEMFCQEFTN